MNKRIIIATFIITLLLAAFTNAQTIKENKVAFTVIDAPWLLMFENSDFEFKRQSIKPDGKSAYYFLTNEKSGLNVSFFIEPAVKCKTSEECRDLVLNAGNPKWGKYQDLKKSKIDDISYFEFFRPKVQDLPLEMLDMYAQFVVDGYWVDMHMSKVQYKKKDHKLFEDFVRSVEFISKTGKAKTATEKNIAAAQKVLEEWSNLWDAGKYKESYGLLSSFTKEVISEKKWIELGEASRKPLGNLKSRKILRIDIFKTIPGIPDRSGAGFSYKSSFDNKDSTYESFSVALDEDGKWRIAFYATN